LTSTWLARRRRVKDQRAPRQDPAQSFDGPNRLNRRQIHLAETHVNGAGGQPQFILAQFRLLDQLVEAGIQRRAHGGGQFGLRRDD
jgi:hypothetical protein